MTTQRRVTCALGLSLGMLLLPVSAQAAATNVSPANGASVASGRPTLRWSMPAGEQAVALHIGSTRARNDDGSFTENAVTYDLSRTPAATSFRLPKELLSGPNFWSVTTATTAEPDTSIIGGASRVNVPLYLWSRNLRANAESPGIEIAYQQRSNAARYSIEYRIYDGTELVGGPSYPFAVGATHGRWESIRELYRFGDEQRAGTKLRVLVTLRSGSVVRHLTTLTTVR